MAVLPLNVNDFARLALTGGSFEIDAAQLSQQDIVRIVSNAKAPGVRIIVNNAGLIPIDALVQIATVGKGVVVFQ